MTPTPPSASQYPSRAAQLLRAFDARLQLNDGVCALNGDDGREAAIIEAPAGGDSLLLHCQLLNVPPTDAALYRLMLQLNFEMAAMRGCWLALDEYDNLRLCAQRELNTLDEAAFAALLTGFIGQGRETKAFLQAVAGKAG